MTHPAATAPTATASAGIPEYPMARASGCPFDPPPALRALQTEGRISRVRLWDGSTPWLVTRYDDERALLSDPRISSDNTRSGYPHLSAGALERRKRAPTFINMDDPDHARLRRMVTARFAIKRVEALRPAIQAIVDELIDAMLTAPKPVDLVEEFALPVPSRVICGLLGVPYADHDFFQSNSRILVKRGTSPKAAGEAIDKLVRYLESLVAEKLAHPGDDLLSKLAVEQVATGEISTRDAAAMGTLLLTAGHETTANMIALGTLALLQHPDQLAALRESDDPGLIAGAVEELLRYLSIVHTGRRRVALADIDFGDVVIRAGDGVILANDAANRDTSVFPDPDRLDIDRGARHHLAFGFGVHQCLGQPLARVELQVVYATLYRRIPTLRLAVDLDQVPFKCDGLVYGVYKLPVTW
ncbi:cytochrome P450 [Streptomyces mirabilis]|uniref:cytochrome P450 n=1 Tax=Streptomyces mirabilis TaxID=68239 RepID=UPI0036DD0AF0